MRLVTVGVVGGVGVVVGEVGESAPPSHDTPTTTAAITRKPERKLVICFFYGSQRHGCSRRSYRWLAEWVMTRVRGVPVTRSFYLFATTRDRQRMPSSIPCSIAFFLRRSSS